MFDVTETTCEYRSNERQNANQKPKQKVVKIQMSKKHFIALANAIKEFNDAGMQVSFRADHIDCLAAFCARQNPNFKMQRWVDYIGGHCGQNGGAIKD